jgi:hypothetical protein
MPCSARLITWSLRTNLTVSMIEKWKRTSIVARE